MKIFAQYPDGHTEEWCDLDKEPTWKETPDGFVQVAPAKKPLIDVVKEMLDAMVFARWCEAFRRDN